jgi:SAM-dependent methyltransferase
MTEPKIREWQSHRGTILDTVNGFDVIECEKCLFKHIIPIPQPDELVTTYLNEYYSKQKPLYLERHQEDLDWLNLVYSDRYDSFEQYLPLERRRILDIGAGPGYFLLHGTKRGWIPTGIEPSRQAAEHSKGLGLIIIEDFFDDRMVKNIGKFDVVHLSEVLEHIPNPIRILKLVENILTPGGLVCVVVPNDYNPIQYTLSVKVNIFPYSYGHIKLAVSLLFG